MKKLTPTYVCLAVDLAKQVFQVAGEDAHGKIVYEDRVKSRDAFSKLLKSLGPEVEVLMESGPGAQAWARQVQEQGGRVRILPAQRVAVQQAIAALDTPTWQERRRNTAGQPEFAHCLEGDDHPKRVSLPIGQRTD